MKEFAGKHILKVVENLSVPFDKRVWREAVALHNAGAKVSVICPRGDTYDFKAFEIINGIQIYRYKLTVEGIAAQSHFSKKIFLIEYTLAFIKTFFLALKVYFKEPFHVIHVANPPDIFFILGLIFKPFRVKFVFDHHDLCPEGYLDKKNKPKKDIYYHIQILFERLTYLTSNLVIATNESYKMVAIKRGKINKDAVFIVRNGPDTDRYKFVYKENFFHKNFKYLVGYIGVMAKLDGVDYLIRAADYIVNTINRKDIGFILIGSGTSIDELKELTSELKLNDYINFTGRIPDNQVFSILSAIDIGAAPDPPSKMNNISTMNKIMDYMWFGKPIVSFDLIESRFSAKKAALYANKPDSKEFAKLIVKLVDNPEMREKMGNFGKERVAKLTWQKSEKELLNAYRFLFTCR